MTDAEGNRGSGEDVRSIQPHEILQKGLSDQDAGPEKQVPKNWSLCNGSALRWPLLFSDTSWSPQLRFSMCAFTRSNFLHFRRLRLVGVILSITNSSSTPTSSQ